jgi:hypothetical protein
MPQDSFKTLKDIELKDVDLDSNINKMNEGYFILFEDIASNNELNKNKKYTVIPVVNKICNEWYVIITGGNKESIEPTLNNDLKKTFEESQSKLTDKDGNPTPHYKAYMKYQEEWKNKVEALNKAHEDAFTNPIKLQQWPIESRLYQDDVDQAMNRWVALGFKQEIENAIDILAARGKTKTSILDNDLKKTYEDAQSMLIDKNGNPTPHYKAYMEYHEEWKNKVNSNDVDQAMDRWVTLGFKQEIENALATLAAQDTDPAIALIYITPDVQKSTNTSP